MSIKIFPKQTPEHTTPVCFWCKKPKDKNNTAYPQAVTDYEPCTECEKLWLEHIAMIGVTDKKPHDGRPPITTIGKKHMYPTGRIIVLKETAFTDAFPKMPQTTKNTICSEHKAFIDDAVLKQIQSTK